MWQTILVRYEEELQRSNGKEGALFITELVGMNGTMLILTKAEVICCSRLHKSDSLKRFHKGLN